MNPRGVGAWRIGVVTATRMLTGTGRSILLNVPGWPGSIAGQHTDVRLTAADGYQAARSYSLASVGAGERIELAVDRLPDGEVSPYLVDDLAVGDELEVRGPLGGWFVWRPEAVSTVPSLTQPAPVQLIGGGSGIVPLIAMMRAHRTAGSAVPFRLLYSVRSPNDTFFGDELERPGPFVDVTILYTRRAPDGWSRSPARITEADLTRSVVRRCGRIGVRQGVRRTDGLCRAVPQL